MNWHDDVSKALVLLFQDFAKGIKMSCSLLKYMIGLRYQQFANQNTSFPLVSRLVCLDHYTKLLNFFVYPIVTSSDLR